MNASLVNLTVVSTTNLTSVEQSSPVLAWTDHAGNVLQIWALPRIPQACLILVVTNYVFVMDHMVVSLAHQR